MKIHVVQIENFTGLSKNYIKKHHIIEILIYPIKNWILYNQYISQRNITNT